MIFAVFMFGSIVFAPSAKAASIYFVPVETMVSAGDTTRVDVKLNTEGESLNVVEGSVVMQAPRGLVSIEEINDAGSEIGFWSRRPSLNQEEGTITFNGGIPNGLIKTDALLFSLYIKTNRPGNLNLATRNTIAYKNDGKGSIARESDKTIALTVTAAAPSSTSKDAWQKAVSSDTMPPEFLAATAGHDPSVFDNKIFLTIKATDYQSGIDYFEVQENDGSFIRTGAEYVLHDQSQQSTVTIKAYDKAGNVRLLVIRPATTTAVTRTYVVVAAIALLVILLGLLLRKRKR